MSFSKDLKEALKSEKDGYQRSLDSTNRLITKSKDLEECVNEHIKLVNERFDIDNATPSIEWDPESGYFGILVNAEVSETWNEKLDEMEDEIWKEMREKYDYGIVGRVTMWIYPTLFRIGELK